MKPVTVESSTLLTVSYEAEFQQLQLEFCDHTVYRYFRVPARFTKD